jgi:hypothetical protein
MTDTPPDWVLIEAAKRCGWANTLTINYLQRSYVDTMFYRALCDMIAKHEQPPVDRKLLCAQAAVTGALIELDASRFPKKEYMWDCCVRAIELWIEGYGE